MKTVIYFFLIFSLVSCKKEKTNKTIIPKPKKITQKVKRDIDFITDSIITKIQSNPNAELDSFVRSKITFKQFRISNPVNVWIYNTEFYENGNLKEKGLYLNGWHFGKWFEYDKNGKIISEIDYSNSKVIVGKKMNLESVIEKYKIKSDSLLIDTFGELFFKNQIRYNIQRSAWFSSSSSGSFLEQRKSIPEKFLFRYFIVENDTLVLAPIEIGFEKESNFEIKLKTGIPKKPYNFKVDYKKAMDIAEKNGFGRNRHKTEFSGSEYLRLLYKKEDQSYYWTISNVSETYMTGNHKRGVGETLSIKCDNGSITIEDFQGGIIYD